MGNERRGRNSTMWLQIDDGTSKRLSDLQTRRASSSEEGVRIDRGRRGLQHLPKGQAINSRVIFDVTVIYDNEEKIWVAQCDLLGIVTEADTFELLTQQVHSLVPDMISVNKIHLGSKKPFLNFSHLEEAVI